MKIKKITYLLALAVTLIAGALLIRVINLPKQDSVSVSTEIEIDCEDDFDCDNNSYCDYDSELCTPFKLDGAACGRDEECLNFNCVLGKCNNMSGDGATDPGSTDGIITPIEEPSIPTGGSCLYDGECQIDSFCLNNQCYLKKNNEQSCTKATQCKSGFCKVDKVTINATCQNLPLI